MAPASTTKTPLSTASRHKRPFPRVFTFGALGKKTEFIFTTTRYPNMKTDISGEEIKAARKMTAMLSYGDTKTAGEQFAALTGISARTYRRYEDEGGPRWALTLLQLLGGNLGMIHPD